MGTDKRQRQKEGRQARIAAAEEAQRRATRRRKYITFAVMAIAVLAVFSLINLLTKKDSKKSVATANSSSTTVSTEPPTTLASAAGKPCVAMTGTPPTGAPTVPVQVGPPPTQLIVKDLKEGTGTPVTATDTVTVQYIGVACSTGKVFDSSWKTGQPLTIGLDGVIKGWTQGIPGMKPGGQRLLGIPSDLAYGAQGNSGIAPNEPLWFVVDMVSATPATTTTTPAAASPTTAAPTTTK
jgi:peptidylprolyl isomerase